MAEHNWKENNPMSSDDAIWDKDTEPNLEGKLVKIELGVGPNKSKLYSIEKDDGTVVKAWGSTVLDDRFKGVPQGTYIKLTYEGKKKGQNGKEYNNFKVFVDQDSVPQAPLGGEDMTDDANGFEDLPEGF